MTGGTVVVLGKTGRNFAAGMSGGVAYVYDEDGRFGRRCNTSMVALEAVLPREQQAGPAEGLHRGMADEALLKKLIEDHHRWTGSLRARELLDHWAEARGKFVKVFPHEYKRVLGERAAKAKAVRTELV
jgi:glutamate synthase (NADPH/NADH) large chain